MKIKNLLTGMFAVALIAATSLSIAHGGAAKDGKAIFADKKCDMCHSVNSLDIASKKKSGAVDLSNTGAAGDAEFMVKYLKKEEAIKGKKHPSNWRGTDEELEVLAAWLADLKEE